MIRSRSKYGTPSCMNIGCIHACNCMMSNSNCITNEQINKKIVCIFTHFSIREKKEEENKH